MGGAQYQIKCLIDYLRTLDRYDIHYLAHRVPNESQVDGCTIHRVGHGGEMPRFGFVEDAPSLYAVMRRLRPDVIYQRVGCAYTGIAAFFARRAGCSLVWHASSDTDLHPTLKLAKRNFIRQRLERSLLSYGIRHAGRIVTQTEQQARLLLTNFRRRPDAVIPNFHPDPAETIDKSGAPRVVWIANVKRLKQPEVFLRLANALQDIDDARFVMIGAGEERTGDSPWHAALMRDIATAPNVDCLGQLSQRDVNAELAKAHVFVNTSLYEGFPNTFIQAWMRGAIIVSLNVNPDGVFDGDAIGFHAGTEERMAGIVRRLISDPALRETIARRASAHATEFHSMKNAHRLEGIIRSAADKSAMSQI
jgi:glycosyltransferase involved in cell wall biosynthesis